MLGASATIRMPREPPSRPATIQGRRMPSREAVRSLSLPKNGFPTMANRAPVPLTTARLLGAWSIPTSELTFSAKVTSRGARNNRLMLMNAKVYSEMNPHPTRRASAAFGCSSRSSPVLEALCSEGEFAKSSPPGERSRPCYGEQGAPILGRR
jgi:hypothetical protein